MKRVAVGLVALAAIAIMLFSPFSVIQAKTNYTKLETALEQFNQSRGLVDASKASLTRSQKQFEDARTSQIYFGDIERLATVLDNTVNISVSDWEACSAEDYFNPVPKIEGVAPTAVKFNLVVTDISSALSVIDALELPIYEILVTEPNSVSVTFLTGEAIN